MVSEERGKSRIGRLKTVLLRQIRRKQSQYGRLEETCPNKADSQYSFNKVASKGEREKVKHLYAMTQAIMYAVIDSVRPVIQAISEAVGPAERQIHQLLPHILTPEASNWL